VIDRLSTNLKAEQLNFSKKKFALNDMMKLLREERLTHLAAVERSNNRRAEERVIQLASLLLDSLSLFLDRITSSSFAATAAEERVIQLARLLRKMKK
jgi:hypothetical protein